MRKECPLCGEMMFHYCGDTWYCRNQRCGALVTEREKLWQKTAKIVNTLKE